MLILIGYILFLASMFLSLGLIGDFFSSLFQPLELLMFAGTALSALFVAYRIKVLKTTWKPFRQLFKATKYEGDIYEELLSLLYCLLAKVRMDGFRSIEADIEEPEQSPIFTNFPNILARPHYICSLKLYFRMMIAGSTNPTQIANLILLTEQQRNEEAKALNCIRITLLAYLNGNLPQPAVKFGREMLYSNESSINLDFEAA
jgi:chemotaxis protein MotA